MSDKGEYKKMDALLVILKWFLILSSPIWITVFLLLSVSFGWFIYYRFVLKMKIRPSTSTYKPPSFFLRVIWLFPHRWVLDMFLKDPDEFKEHGLHMFCGEQGSGKTTSVVHLLMMMKEKYPKAKVRTNMNYLHQDGEINHWTQLVANENGEHGQIEVLDEIQTWFSSLNSKDFPPEMITEISQQRKQRKMLVGTAQVFSRMAKPIREQTTRVYLPVTFFGCFTWVRVSKPQYWDDEKQTFKRFIKHYFFVHTDKLRNSFDTYQKIEKYKQVGFKEDSTRVNNMN